MSEAYTITIQGEKDATRGLNVLPLGLHTAIGKAVANEVKDHLQKLDNSRANKLGGKRSHFYWNAAQTVTSTPTTDGAEVSIDYLGLRQRWQGGTITAQNAHYLTIPARSESYGVPAREFPKKLKFVSFRSGAKALVIDDEGEAVDSIDEAGNVSIKRGKRRRMKTAGLVEYWLVPSVYQAPDPSVLPLPEVLINVAVNAAEEFYSE